ncbi:hypothetical protein ABT294_15930 [Nonomuraea sp. NPDC000554]|uniref:hypothetical protein n=1 Tax=Nonomuraea sp. NPDC000554 TaxID=3154259 RepID=UPI0033240B6C
MYFELCHAGGLAFVRRIIQGDEEGTVRETEWAVVPDIDRLWDRILKGETR